MLITYNKSLKVASLGLAAAGNIMHNKSEAPNEKIENTMGINCIFYMVNT